VVTGQQAYAPAPVPAGYAQQGAYPSGFATAPAPAGYAAAPAAYQPAMGGYGAPPLGSGGYGNPSFVPPKSSDAV